MFLLFLSSSALALSLALGTILFGCEGCEVFWFVYSDPGLHFLEGVDGLDMQGLQLLGRSLPRRLLGANSFAGHLLPVLHLSLFTKMIVLGALSLLLNWSVDLRKFTLLLCGNELLKALQRVRFLVISLC